MESRVTVRSIAALSVAERVAVGDRQPSGAAEPKLGNGVGTQAALTNPNCDPETRQIKILLIARVPCVKDVAAADNGGNTAQGVTATP